MSTVTAPPKLEAIIDPAPQTDPAVELLLAIPANRRFVDIEILLNSVASDKQRYRCALNNPLFPTLPEWVQLRLQQREFIGLVKLQITILNGLAEIYDVPPLIEPCTGPERREMLAEIKDKVQRVAAKERKERADAAKKRSKDARTARAAACRAKKGTNPQPPKYGPGKKK